MSSKKMIIPLSKEDEEERLFVKGELEEKRRTEIEPKKKNIEQDEKSLLDINQFLKESEADKWAIEKIRKLDECIRSADNSIWGKRLHKQKKERHKYFSFYKENNSKPLLFIRPRQGKKEFEVFLRKNKTTSGFDAENFYKGNETVSFKRMILIKDEPSYKKFFKEVKNYLKEIINHKRRNLSFINNSRKGV
ncbi:hypothetical protein C1645_735626 [Glomus cerebriforme]|uniref:Uncharacterized protein n=1 Tax=Glomus cerebriforme TaxID=658196 RepID=A0A397T5A1_9GLOM|nr:hypothetical protein C1645_735626 [Glomus cerebriforme]